METGEKEQKDSYLGIKMTEDSGKLDSLKFIAQLQRDEFHNRQKHEWKILFAILTVFALLISAILEYRESFDADKLVHLPWVLLGICSVYIIYRIFIQINNHKNKSYAHQAENAIVAILNGDDPRIIIKKDDEPKIVIKYELERWWFPFRHLWSTGCHIAIVILFAWVAVIMIRSIA